MSVWCGSGAAVCLLAVLSLMAGGDATQQQHSELTPLHRELVETPESLNQMTTLVDRLATKLSSLESLVARLQTQFDELALRMDRVEKLTKTRPRDCSELWPEATSGIYSVYPDHSQDAVQAFCQEDIDGGKMWTVFQRRDDAQPHQDFNLGWVAYKQGFGNLTGNFWWGLEHLSEVTAEEDRRYELRIDLEAFDGAKRHAIYSTFKISPEEDGYRLNVSAYTGDAGDGLNDSVNWRFSTGDRDNDGWTDGNCAEYNEGPWWYAWGCGPSNLNGGYREDGIEDHTGIWWWEWRGYNTLKKVQMKIRPA